MAVFNPKRSMISRPPGGFVQGGRLENGGIMTAEYYVYTRASRRAQKGGWRWQGVFPECSPFVPGLSACPAFAGPCPLCDNFQLTAAQVTQSLQVFVIFR